MGVIMCGVLPVMLGAVVGGTVALALFVAGLGVLYRRYGPEPSRLELDDAA